MVETQFNGRIRLKIDTTENWNNAVGFIPLKGEIIIYSDYDSEEVDGKTVYIPNMKIGDGKAYCIDLPFIPTSDKDALMAHIQNTDVHTTAQEKEFWNNKVRCYVETVEQDGTLVDGDNLIFTIN